MLRRAASGDDLEASPLHSGDTPTEAARPEQLELSDIDLSERVDAKDIAYPGCAEELKSPTRADTFEHTDSDGKIPWSLKLSYGAPEFCTASISFLVTVHGNRFYQQIGASLAFISFFTAMARSADVMTDPCMGWWSDTTRNKPFGISGRRRPYFMTGCFFHALLLCLLFSPPFIGEATAYYFGVFYVLFFLFDTYCNVPFKALGPELTDSYDERNTLFMVAKLFFFAGLLFAAAGPPIIKSIIRGGEYVYMWECKDFYDTGANGNAYHIPDNTTKCESASGALCFYTDIAGDKSYYETPLDEVEYVCGTLNIALGADGTYGFNSTNAANQVQFTYYSVGEIDSLRAAFTTTAVIFGVWYVVAQLNLGCRVTERPASVSTVNPPLVASILRCLKNVAFRPLLIGWGLDGLGLAALAATFPFYIEYVVEPNGYIAVEDGNAMEVDICLGLCMVGLLVASMLSLPLWLLVSNYCGKYQTWVGYNFLQGFTIVAFIAVGEGNSSLVILIALLNGIPTGAQFLNESILADTIAYDEFLNGVRSEGSFTVFGTLIPKFVAIPAAAIPLAIINMLGFVPPVEGVAQPQPERVKYFIKGTFVLLPFVCAICGMLIKISFPIRTRQQNEDIQRGIELHHDGKPAVDPLTGEMVELLVLTPEEEQEAWSFENFAEEWLQKLLIPEEQGGGPKPLVNYIRKMFYGGVGLVTFWTIMTCGTFAWLHDAKKSIVPIISVIALGLAICFTGLNFFRLLAAKSIKDHVREEERSDKDRMIYKLIEKLIESKKKGQRAGKAPIGLCAQICSCFTCCCPADGTKAPTTRARGESRFSNLSEADGGFDTDDARDIPRGAKVHMSLDVKELADSEQTDGDSPMPSPIVPAPKALEEATARENGEAPQLEEPSLGAGVAAVAVPVDKVEDGPGMTPRPAQQTPASPEAVLRNDVTAQSPPVSSKPAAAPKQPVSGWEDDRVELESYIDTILEEAGETLEEPAEEEEEVLSPAWSVQNARRKMRREKPDSVAQEF